MSSVIFQPGSSLSLSSSSFDRRMRFFFGWDDEEDEYEACANAAAGRYFDCGSLPFVLMAAAVDIVVAKEVLDCCFDTSSSWPDSTDLVAGQ